MAHADTPISYQLDALWRVVDASDSLCRLLHCTPRALLGREVQDLVPREARPDYFKQAAKALAGVGACEVRVPLQLPDGSQVIYDQHLEPFVERGCGLRCRAVLHPVPPVGPAWRYHPTPMRLVWN